MAAIDWAQYKESSPDIDWAQYKETPAEEHPAETWGSLFKGASESYPQTLKSGANALMQLAGRQPFEVQQEQPTTNWPEYLGRLAGKGAGAISLAAPAVLGGEALIPGLAGASLGAGAAGAAFTPGGMKERITSGLLDAMAPAALKGVGSAFRLGKAAISPAKPRAAADIIQSAHDVAQESAVNPFKIAAKEAIARDLPPTPVDQSIFDLARKTFSNTEANRRMMQRARTGNYDALRKMQSDMFTKSQSLQKPTKSLAEQNLGEELGAARDELNQTMFNHFDSLGHNDLASMIKKGMNDYAKFKDLYYKNKTIADLVGEEKKVPANLIGTLRRDWTSFKNIREAHPELNKLIRTQEDKEKIDTIEKTLKRLGAGAAGVKYLSGGDSRSHRE